MPAIWGHQIIDRSHQIMHEKWVGSSPSGGMNYRLGPPVADLGDRFSPRHSRESEGNTLDEGPEGDCGAVGDIVTVCDDWFFSDGGLNAPWCLMCKNDDHLHFGCSPVKDELDASPGVSKLGWGSGIRTRERRQQAMWTPNHWHGGSMRATGGSRVWGGSYEFPRGSPNGATLTLKVVAGMARCNNVIQCLIHAPVLSLRTSRSGYNRAYVDCQAELRNCLESSQAISNSAINPNSLQQPRFLAPRPPLVGLDALLPQNAKHCVSGAAFRAHHVDAGVAARVGRTPGL
ncbi:hypothetical protein B0H10DRAFT_1963357 [Mycena sp. CBHHK59/15]|nr:hypothetical protein B0H10DRAFT_1963357 [Mycena sp. CBHHK59/15]